MNNCKVTITGSSIADKNDKLCVIKRGNYEATPEGILKALNDGMFDKYGEFPPEFQLLAAVYKKEANKLPTFAAVLNCMHDDGRTIAAVYAVKVKFQD